MEGEVIVPPSVTVAAGNINASSTTTSAPEVNASHWVFIGARYGQFNGMQARILSVDPPPGPATLPAIGPASQDLIGGNSGRATGGISVTLSTNNASAAQAPGIVNVPGGQTSASLTITTFAVSANTTATITAFYDTTTSRNLPSPEARHQRLHRARPRRRRCPLHHSSARRPMRVSLPALTSHSIGPM